jgi:hypothetical protein
MMYELEHKFIADSDTQNVIRAIFIDRVNNLLALPQVCSAVVVRKVIVTQVDRQVHLCLLDRLELWTRGLLMGKSKSSDEDYHKGRLVAIRAIETDTLSNMYMLNK